MRELQPVLEPLLPLFVLLAYGLGLWAIGLALTGVGRLCLWLFTRLRH